MTFLQFDCNKIVLNKKTGLLKPRFLLIFYFEIWFFRKYQ